MDRWVKKVAVVTGASSGIGSAIVIDLLKQGMVVVGLARRTDRVEELKRKIPEKAKNLHVVRCDVTQESDIDAAFEWTAKTLGVVHVLINNAGVLCEKNLTDADGTSDIQNVVDTNLMGPYICTRYAFNAMKEAKVDGHIVIVNSILGHTIPYTAGVIPSFNMYIPTKWALKGMAEVLRQEFNAAGTKIKISVSFSIVKPL